MEFKNKKFMRKAFLSILLAVSMKFTNLPAIGGMQTVYAADNSLQSSFATGGLSIVSNQNFESLITDTALTTSNCSSLVAYQTFSNYTDNASLMVTGEAAGNSNKVLTLTNDGLASGYLQLNAKASNAAKGTRGVVKYDFQIVESAITSGNA